MENRRFFFFLSWFFVFIFCFDLVDSVGGFWVGLFGYFWWVVGGFWGRWGVIVRLRGLVRVERRLLVAGFCLGFVGRLGFS